MDLRRGLMREIVSSLGLQAVSPGAFGKGVVTSSTQRELISRSPINGEELGRIVCADEAAYERVVQDAVEVFTEWRKVPAPERGDLVRKIAGALRDSRALLGRLVSAEVGKIVAEGEGEIQEAIDIADFAVGLSRQLYGKVMQSERRDHRMYEQWHPLGIVGVITAFNFPAAVWAWNSMIAAVCGDVVVWKPSDEAPLTALAINNICREVARSVGFEGVFSLVIGDGPELGKRLAADRRIPCVSATGSCAMGRSVAQIVGQRLGRCILELGGNNAVTVLADADMQLVVPGLLFGAVGTAGQRCTSIRRVLVEESVCSTVLEKLKAAYQQVRIGNPLEKGTLMGPLINQRAVDAYEAALARIKAEGGEIVCGGRVLPGMPSSLYVEPTIVKAKQGMPILQEETFAPILYVVPVRGLEEAIELNNDVPQGLSSAIFTRNFQAVERFLSSSGSDCGIANVNMGTSGAEIGGAFGGEKDTGGGREAGSDSWKQYMRRQTCNVNFGNSMPLAQGIVFA
jgi:aldehyde dehydrogenase (NAD+)